MTSPSQKNQWAELFDAARPLEERTALAFAADGPLARRQTNFTPREGQLAFAQAVAEAIQNKETLLAEAGTGTGKSFAYLVPALLSGSTVVISTAGKPLQDQLFNKDIPALSAALGVNVPTAVLKGRSNYVCPYRLERTESEGLLPERDSYRKLREIKRFAAISATGDRAELPTVPEDDPLWPLVTSTRENCLGKERCEHWENCFVRAAREKALKSQIVVVNHHLFLSSLALKREANGQIDGMLPAADLTVIDEAHQLPGIATDFFGTTFTTWQLESIADEARALGRGHANDGADWDALCHAVQKKARDLVIAARGIGIEPGDRLAVKTIERFEELTEPFGKMLAAFGQLIRAMRANKDRSDDLDALCEYACEVDLEMAKWETLFKRFAHSEGKAEDASEEAADIPLEGFKGFEDTLVSTDSRGDADAAQGGTQRAFRFQKDAVQWISAAPSSLRFNNTPLKFADEFRQMREAEGGAWVFTSATLSTAGDFTHFAIETGIPEAKAGTWESPFNYWEQGCFYLPQLPPPTNTIEHAGRVVDAAWPLVCAAKGRTFFLCTSLVAVSKAAEELRALLDHAGNPYPLFVQGDMPKAALIDAFREHGNAILVGSMSFWEGVDVQGEALSLVVIDKLPFAPPDDPVYAARSDALREQGKSPFALMALPEAVTALKQGSGRLIRSETDRGVFMLCDSRVADKPYGRTILKSLPDFFRTRSLEKALEFFRSPQAWHKTIYRQ